MEISHNDQFVPKSLNKLEEFAKEQGLIYFNLVRTDWFFNKILQYKKGLITSFLLITGLFLITEISGLIEGIFINNDLEVDMAKDIGHWGIVIFDYFLVWFSFKLYKHFSRMFIILFRNKIIFSDSNSFNQFFNRFDKIVNTKITVISIYFISLCTFLTQYLSMPLSVVSSWHVPYELTKISITSFIFIPLNLLMHVLVVQLVIRVIISCVLLIQFFLNEHFTFNIQILHPDKCGGLGVIGIYTLYLNILVFITGIFLTQGLLSNTYIYNFDKFNLINIFLVIIFLVCSFVLVFSPVMAAHKRMRFSKDEMHNVINKNFEVENEKLRKILYSDKSLTNNDIDTIESIQKIYNIVNYQPTWPFNYKVIYTFIISVISPLAVLVSKLLPLLISKF